MNERERERVWTDVETKKIFALHDGDNYIMKHVGFCSLCNHCLVQNAKLIIPDKKEWLEVNCQKCSPRDYYPYNR